MDALITSTLREIKSSLGRYAAIMAITALGVGLFAGLRYCRPMLVASADEYVHEYSLYDFYLLSTMGWGEDQVLALAEDPAVKSAQGALYEDALVSLEGEDQTIRIHSLTDSVNIPRILSGRMPQGPDECLVDADYFTEDILGQTIELSSTNDQDTLDAFTQREFKVVGICTSPLYMSIRRGSTSLGSGQIAAFIIVPRESFTSDYYSEIYLSLRDDGDAYSQDYEKLIEDSEGAIQALADSAAWDRYEELVLDNLEEIDQGWQELEEAQTTLDESLEDARQQVRDMMSAMGFDPDENPGYYNRFMDKIQESFQESQQEIDDARQELTEAQEELEDIDEPTVYLLTRDENAGYAGFKQDSAIIENISVVFPVFFFMVAALVCVTTMTRMVDEQRTQIGVWKAMGYERRLVSMKYMAYAGSAGIIGCVGGFMAFTYLLPTIFWIAYRGIYNFTQRLSYEFQPGLFFLSVAIALLCTAGVSAWSCRRELREAPASILRPKAPKDGKRTVLEHLGFLWRRLSFLQKVSLRNVLRYKQRFFLMILGVSGCTALLVTGFGIRDSIQDVTEYQYNEISLYDAQVYFSGELSREEADALLSGGDIEDACLLAQESMDLRSDSAMKSTQVTALVEGDITGLMDLKRGEEQVSMPSQGELILSQGIADKLSLEPGDTVTIAGDGLKSRSFTLTGIFDNYIYDYVFVSLEDLRQLKEDLGVSSAYISFTQGTDLGTASAALLGQDDVSRVALCQDTKDTIDSSFESLNVIVVLIIICAGALAFIVLFNLININIGERIREIATLKVLGFYNGEYSAYVFREVNMLTALGALLGLGLGKLLHAFVMDQIRPDSMCFDIRIAPLSYVFSLIATFLFAVLVRLAMSRKLGRINMTEALKSVE